MALKESTPAVHLLRNAKLQLPPAPKGRGKAGVASVPDLTETVEAARFFATPNRSQSPWAANPGSVKPISTKRSGSVPIVVEGPPPKKSGEKRRQVLSK